MRRRRAERKDSRRPTPERGAAAAGVSGLFGMPAGRRAMEAVAEALPELRRAVS